MIPGEIHVGDDPIVLNAGRATLRLTVANTGDRAVQVGSHFHFAEVNEALAFDRDAALGMRLNVPAGMALRFEPGDVREVDLVAYAGERRIIGFRNQIDGTVE